MQVTVTNGIDKALRQLKKKMRNEGVFQDMEKSKYYTKPSIKKRIAKKIAIRRQDKLRDKINQR